MTDRIDQLHEYAKKICKSMEDTYDYQEFATACTAFFCILGYLQHELKKSGQSLKAELVLQIYSEMYRAVGLLDYCDVRACAKIIAQQVGVFDIIKGECES